MKVSLVECNSYDKEEIYNAVKKSLDDIEFKIKPKIKVLIKPNVLSQNPPDKYVTTHPTVVDSLVKIFKNADCEVIIAESSGFYKEGGTNKALEISGMKSITEKHKISLINLEIIPVKQIKDKNAVVYKNPEISGLIFDVDLIVNVPKLKTHTLVKYTGAVKNLFGTIPGGRKQNLHVLGDNEEKFSQILVDIYQNIKPELNVMDAVIGLEGDGPGTGGRPKVTNLIIASISAPALDIVASEVIGYNPLDIFTNRYCIERELVKPEDIEIIGKKKTVKYKKPKSTSRLPSFIIKWFMKKIIMNPYANKKKCKKCGVCRDICPVGAIKFEPFPKFDKKKCINCYCCHENCPHDAIELKGSKILKIGRFLKRIFSRIKISNNKN